MHILLTGSHGFIGSALLKHLENQGHTVAPFRHGEKLDRRAKYDAVIHLAGESIVGRWTKKKKKRILESRIEFPRMVAELERPPKVFISASAVGFYGDRGEELLTEESETGQGFMPHVCREWERAADILRDRGVRTVQTRFGLVIGKGGLVKKMRPLFRCCLGGKLGSGKQWMSWIALEDLVRAIEFVLNDSSIHGPINFTSPHAVREGEFVQEMGRRLHRPTFFHQSEWMLRLALGEMADELLLSSTRVEPVVLTRSGFVFHFPNIGKALQKALD